MVDLMIKKFPEKFVERIQKILPETEWADFFEKCTEPLPKVIRMSNYELRITNDDWKLGKTAIPEAFFIEREAQKTLPLGKTLEHFCGKIYVQSLSSMLPVVILDPKPGEKILDMCAAPGSKTTFLAQRMQNIGLIVANEPSSSRSKKLAANLDRMGVLNTVMIQSDGVFLEKHYGQEFEKILLDAPCSSEGFGRKDSSFFSKMWAERKIFEAAKLQKKLISSAFALLCPGGEMIYSTCTSAPEENECVVQYLLDTFGNMVEILEVFSVDVASQIPHKNGLNEWDEKKISPEISKKCIRLYPHLRNEIWNSETFFLCKIRKKESLKIEPPYKPIQKNPLNTLKKNHQAEISVRLAKTFGFKRDWIYSDGSPSSIPSSERNFDRNFVLGEKSDEIYLMTLEGAAFCKKNLYRRAGLKILDKERNITTEFALKFGNLATENFIELNETQKNRWLEGYDIELPSTFLSSNTKNSSVLIRYQNFCLGWGKLLNGKIKNKLDRDLI